MLQFRKKDAVLGIAVLAVDRNQVSDSTKNQIQEAVLGNSNMTYKGDVVIALGSLFGYSKGMGYGHYQFQ